MKKIFTMMAAMLLTVSAWSASEYDATILGDVTLTDLTYEMGGFTVYKYQLDFQQNGVNRNGGNHFTSTACIILEPLEKGLAGTYRLDDYSVNANSYVLFDSKYRYVTDYTGKPTEIVITDNQDGSYTISGAFRTKNGNNYYYYYYDATAAANTFTPVKPDPYAAEPTATIEKTLNYTNMYAEEENTPIKFYAYDESTYDDVELQFNMPSYNIPAGSYNVANTGADNTVQAASGEIINYFPAPTYVSFYDEFFNQTIYFITGGSVTVAYSQDGSTITMTGTLTSAHGSTFTLNLSGTNPFPYTPTALVNVTADTNVTKNLRNGQVLILKDNKTYNVLGQEVK